jgi:signal transduction histidine kinase
LVFAGLGLAVSVAIVVLHVANRSRESYDINTFGYAQAMLVLAEPMLGALILRRHPRHPIGWIFVGIGLSSGLAGLGHEWAVFNVGRSPQLAGADIGLWVGDWLWLPGFELLPTVVILLFPTGRPPSKPWWIVVGAAVVFVVVDMAWAALTPLPPDVPADLVLFEHPLGRTGEPHRLEDVAGFVPAFALGLVLLSVAGMITRLLRSRGVERDQLLWFVLGACGWIAILVLEQFVSALEPIVGPLAAILFLLGGAAIGMLRHNLLDVNRVINRALAFALLSGLLAVVYVATIGLAAALFGRRNDPVVTGFGIAAVVAAAYPLRSRLQRAIDRLMYGDRVDPYALSSRLQEQIAVATDRRLVMSTIAETIEDSLKLSGVEIYARRGDDLELASSTGRLERDPLQLPLRHQGEDVGKLTVSRWRGEPFRADEIRLLEGLALQLASAVHSVRVADDLHRSRELLVLSREEERRRIRRDLHDGLGPTLAAIALQLDLAREAGNDDTPQVLGRLKDEVTAAIADVRNLVYDLRPPALDELGLVAALEQWLSALRGPQAPSFVLNVDGDLGSLPAAVEVAVYRIVSEAVTNVVRHAAARRCEIELALDGALSLEIRDDGIGLPDGYRSGVGVASIRERVAELGGTLSIIGTGGEGTTVGVRIPRGSW